MQQIKTINAKSQVIKIQRKTDCVVPGPHGYTQNTIPSEIVAEKVSEEIVRVWGPRSLLRDYVF